MKLSYQRDPSPEVVAPSAEVQKQSFLRRGEGLACLRSNLGQSRDSSPEEVKTTKAAKAKKPKMSSMKAMLRKVIRQELDKTQLSTDRSNVCLFKSPTVHSGVRCDSCGAAPIHGIRYKCYICPNFDVCEQCEGTISHPHPFIKIKDPETWSEPKPAKVLELDIDMADIPELIGNGFNLIKDKIVEMVPDVEPETLPQLIKEKIAEIIPDVETETLPNLIKEQIAWMIPMIPHRELVPEVEFLNSRIHGTEYRPCGLGHEKRVLWICRNSGTVAIPAGTTLQATKNEFDLQHEAPRTGLVAPGETFEIGMNFTVPETPGDYTAAFTLATPSGKVFGPELTLAFQAAEETEEVAEP